MKRILSWVFVLVAVVVAILIMFRGLDSISTTTGIPKKIDYNFHVRPILSDKCFACHGPDEDARKAELRLDIPENAYSFIKDSQEVHVIKPGDPNGSELVNRINSVDSAIIMPPPESKLHLSQYEKDILTEWVGQGAEYSPHWAFIVPEKPELPEVSNEDWVSNEIDYFILNRLEREGLSPNEKASKELLLKRIALDITGLPPGLDLQDKYLPGDISYGEIIDELLESPHYGEKMALHWLDVARYADSHGYQDDGFRTMWPWRDWVIHAFNENYPYDKFVTMQLAGDLIENPTIESILATGFNRNHKITQEGGVIDEEYRVEYVTDRTNTFGKAFLGLTMECAKCHDHKYDPVSMEDYYGTFAFFNQVPEKGLFGTIDASFADPPNMKITSEMVDKEVPFVNLPDSSEVEVMIMKDSVGIRNTYLLNRGAYDNRGKQVDYGTPSAILEFDPGKFEKNRLGLSKWLLDNDNPLTARVFVNRIWNEIFGRGLVSTVGDFGMQGDFPTHPELLDWLASDFVEHNWDVKYLVKKILSSSTYMQSARTSAEKEELDPDNLLYSRYPRSRLKAEEVRDLVLASSGLLNREIGGPSVKPYQPEGLWQAATSGRGTLQRYIPDRGSDLYRRGIYTFIKRTVPPPSMLVFDASNRDQCEVDRLETNTPLQALIMLNDPQVLEASRVLAQNLLSETEDVSELLETAFRKIVCRKAKADELELLISYYNDLYDSYSEQGDDVEQILNVGEFELANELEPKRLAALMQVIHTIYNMEESISKT